MRLKFNISLSFALITRKNNDFLVYKTFRPLGAKKRNIKPHEMKYI